MSTKKAKFQVRNNSGYDIIHFETDANLVIENSNKRFVSDSEKSNWNSKANSNHNHDGSYYTKSQTDNLLGVKANINSVASKGNLGPNDNLDNFNGQGIYCNPANAHATSANKYPEQEAGNLIVGTGAYGSACQIYHTFNTNRMYIRGGGNSTAQKTAWTEVYTKINKPSWNDITNKPSSFNPSSHTHDDRYYTEAEVNNLLNSKLSTSGTAANSNKLNGLGTYSGQVGISGIPIIGSDGVMEVGNMIDFHNKGSNKDYDGRLAINSNGQVLVFNGAEVYTTSHKPSWNDIQSKPSTFTPSSHTHDDRYFSRNGEVNGTTNWNSLIQPGCYKIQMSAWGDASTNAPRQGYSYGLLMVYRTSVGSEDRIYQEYFPHREDEARWFRMCNSGGWQNWQPIDVRQSADARYLGKTAKAESSKVADSVHWNNISGKPGSFNPSSHTHDDRYMNKNNLVFTDTISIITPAN